MQHVSGSHLIRLLSSEPDVLQLDVDVGGAADLHKNLACALLLAALQQAVGGLREDDAADQEDDGREHGQPQGCAPAPLPRNVLCACNKQAFYLSTPYPIYLKVKTTSSLI